MDRRKFNVPRLPVRSPRGERDSVVGEDDAARANGASTDGHIESVRDSMGVFYGADGPADDPATEGTHRATAVNLSFPRRMLPDVVNSECTEPRSVKAAFDQIVTGEYDRGLMGLGAARKPIEARFQALAARPAACSSRCLALG